MRGNFTSASRTIRALAVCWGCLCAASAATAQESLPLYDVPEPVRANEQCGWDSAQAKIDLPTDLGAGLALQRGQIAVRGVLRTGFLLTDCNVGKAVAVRETSPDRGTDLDPYKVSANTKINDLIDLARGRNELFDVVTARQDLSWSKYDPFCACALLYPESPGAKAARTK